MRRWIKVAVAAAAVVGLGGWIAAPFAQDWWLVRTACDGALPGDAVRQLAKNGSHFKDAESVTYRELGEYRCTLSFEGDDLRSDLVLRVEAYTHRDQQDREFLTTFQVGGFIPQSPVPQGLPGFIDRFGAVQFLLPCPDLGKDDDGRRRKLLVRTQFGQDALWGHPAAYETAVGLVNGVSDRLGCGAEPLTAPDGDAGLVEPEEDPKTVPLAEAGDTGCGWVTRAGLPDEGGWRVADGTNDAAPTGRCLLYDQKAADGGNGDRLTFVAWYGDWSSRFAADDGGRPLSLTATAGCAGEAAHFAVGGSDEIPGVGQDRRRDLLEAFARDQVERRGCSGLLVR
ncbi:hypothetical protein [Streptomyces griseoloalbus]|uniref:Uncharacterized protein n=1 Tax=Streptomyces griseoloalbus TaxID=67303 RepID=A0A7W8F8Q2_9ACTN|nr:hypothetical protein [Streptomyces albaduncus]MBB5125330.1 hypothetical protein [Streptomyces albaduncus]GGW28438.1 hypothetical protein GCM10010340_02480 [Streptomyces albaduncus]